MITCSDECEQGACCDVCIYFDFNGNELDEYTGDGWCERLDEHTDPGEVCDEFHCFRAE